MAAASELPTLLGITVRRTLVVGRVSVIVGCIMVTFYAAAFGLEGPLFTSIGTLVLPIFAVSGGIGGALVFANDRTKGVLEYLVAYGLSARRILFNVLIAGLVQATIVLGVGTVAGVSSYLLSGYALTPQLPEALLTYTFPMSYLTVCMMTTVGVFWTSLSSPRAGMNSPIGVLPLIGVAPTSAALVLALSLRTYATQVLLGTELAIAVIVLLLITRTSQLMPTERLLSTA